MLRYFLYVAIAITAAHASGEFVVLHSPSSVTFNGNEEIDQSLLKEVFAACLGFTVKQRGTWSGITITNPFQLPEAIVGIAIEGVQTLDTIKGKRFPLNVDEVEETTWQALSGRLAERDNDNTLVRIYLADGLDALGQSALGELKTTPMDEMSLTALSLQKEEDRKFLEEVQLLYAIAKKAPSAIKPDYKPDVYWLVISQLDVLSDFHGENSTTMREAVVLLNKALNNITEAFINAYDGQVVVAVFTNDASQVRHARAAPPLEKEDKDPNDVGGLNLAKNYSDDYPVIFNILLWFGVVFVFSLLAICIAIADMDPGRDSIIYRMTSNRMKKDN